MNMYEALIAPNKSERKSHDFRCVSVMAETYKDAARYFEEELQCKFKIVQIRQIIGTGTTESNLQFD